MEPCRQMEIRGASVVMQSLGVGHRKKTEFIQNAFISSQLCSAAWSMLTPRLPQESRNPETGTVSGPHILLCSELRTLLLNFIYFLPGIVVYAFVPALGR